MSKMHNKKRNVGIIYEQIINFVCGSLIKEDKINAEMATKIIKKHFSEGSQLYKEYKLFKALATTKNTPEQLASSIISEARKACNNMFDNVQLEKEKSRLIRDLNYTFGKGVIFSEKVESYRTYATIQTLLNEWRNNTNNFDKVTEYEIKLHGMLTESSTPTTNTDHVKFDKITYQLMNEMFNKKYKSTLNNDQQHLIGLYVDDNEDALIEKFKTEKTSCLNVLNSYLKNCNNSILIEKRSRILSKIQNTNVNIVNKENLQKFLTIQKLKEELQGE
jgi:dsDNA-binding SOS-regulon protein